MAVRESYTSIISYTSVYGGVSIFRARKIITALGNSLKNAVSEGKDLEILDLFTLTYTASKLPNSFIVENELHTYRNQIDDVSEMLDINYSIIEKVIHTYYKRLNDLVAEGYKVTVKGIASIEPKLKADNSYYVDVIISPVLSELKVTEKEFQILTTTGRFNKQKLKRENLRFNLTLSDSLKTPESAIATRIKLEEIDI